MQVTRQKSENKKKKEDKVHALPSSTHVDSAGRVRETRISRMVLCLCRTVVVVCARIPDWMLNHRVEALVHVAHPKTCWRGCVRQVLGRGVRCVGERSLCRGTESGSQRRGGHAGRWTGGVGEGLGKGGVQACWKGGREGLWRGEGKGVVVRAQGRVVERRVGDGLADILYCALYGFHDRFDRCDIDALLAEVFHFGDEFGPSLIKLFSYYE